MKKNQEKLHKLEVKDLSGKASHRQPVSLQYIKEKLKQECSL